MNGDKVISSQRVRAMERGVDAQINPVFYFYPNMKYRRLLEITHFPNFNAHSFSKAVGKSI